MQQQRFNPTVELLAKPYAKRLLNDWAFWVSIASIGVFALTTSGLPLASRADIVRGTITLSVPLIVALLAIVVAAFAIFSTLSTDEFREELEDQYEYLTSFFFITMSATILTTVYAVVLFLLSYADNVVKSDGFFWACMVGLGALLLCFLQVLDTGRTVSLQALALRLLAKRKAAEARAASIQGAAQSELPTRKS